MQDWRSLSHVRWECKYHVVIIPKYRKKVFFGRMRGKIGEILRELCRQRGINLLEGHAMPGPIMQVTIMTAQATISADREDVREDV